MIYYFAGMGFQLGKLKIFGSKKSAPGTVIGVDIGAASIKIAQVQLLKDRAVLSTYGELSTGIYEGREIGRVVAPTDERLSQMLKDLLKESEATARAAAIALPLRYGFMKMLELPQMPAAEIASTVQFEARKYIPLPISEVNTSWEYIQLSPEEQQQKQGKIPILLTALQREMESYYARIVDSVGLSSAVIELEVSSAVRSVIGRIRTPTVVIDVGAATTKIAIVEQGSIRSVLGSERGGQNLTLTLAQAMNVEFQRAEEMKRSSGIIDRPETREVRATLLPVIDAIFQDVERLRRHYQKTVGHDATKVILVGGTALLPGLVEYAAQFFGLETALGNPFMLLEYPAAMEPIAKSIAPPFAVAVGLAFAGFNAR